MARHVSEPPLVPWRLGFTSEQVQLLSLDVGKRRTVNQRTGLEGVEESKMRSFKLKDTRSKDIEANAI